MSGARLASIVALGLVIAWGVAAAPAAAADFVGMGDSYSSGTGTGDGNYDDDCIRTQFAYPVLIDSQLPGSGVNVSCSGAKTEDILTNSQSGFPPQIQRPELGADTDYVTVQIGGNDAGFVPVLTDCANPFGDCSGAISEARAKAQNEVPPKLRATYDAIRAKAPSAQVVVVGYPRIFRPGQTCNTFFSASEVDQLNLAAQELGEITRAIAHEKGFAYADPIFGTPSFVGHGACDSAEWINGLSFSVFSKSYHPNETGHSSGYAPLTMNTLNAIPTTSIGSTPPALSNGTSPQVSFTGSGTASSFQCRIDNGAFATCASPKSFAGTAQGQHTIQVRALNAAGDMDQSPASTTFTIDTTPPPVTIDPNQGPTGTVGDPNATFGFSSTDGTATFQCQLDGGGFTPCTSPKSYPGLSDGSHTFTVRATDPASNSATASRTWTVDTAGPSVTIDSGPPAVTSSISASFTFSADETVAFTCSLDGAPALPCISGQPPYVGLSGGEHTFTVTGTDTSVPPHSGSDTYTWTVDLTPPDTTIETKPSNPSGIDPAGSGSTGSANFTFGAGEPGSTFECRLDVPNQPVGTFSSCTSPKSYTGLTGSGNNYTFHVRATDPQDNTDPTPATYSWRVDTTRPTTIKGASSGSLVGPNDASVAFTSNEPNSTFVCKLDVAEFAPCTSPATFAGLTTGNHVFQVKAIDPAGNETHTAISHSWTVDATPPVSAITGGPAEGSASGQATPQFTFTATEANPAGMTFECVLDNGSFSSCNSPKTLSSLSDGPHTFGVRARDRFGNQETTVVAIRNWTVDTTPPDTALGSAPSGPTADDEAEVNFTSPTGDTTGFECSLDSAAFQSCASPQTLTGLGQGAHTYAVRAKDAAGNVDPTPATATWTVDTLAPETTIDTGPSGPTSSSAASFTFSSQSGSTFACKLDQGDFAPCTSPHPLTGLGQGSHTLSVAATDPAGNLDPSPATRTWTVDTIPPDTDFSTKPPASTTDTSATFAFGAEPSSSFQCKLDTAAFAPCTSPVQLAGLAVGSHTFQVRATDSAGNPETTAAQHDWTITAPQQQQQGGGGGAGTQLTPGAPAATKCKKPKKGRKAAKAKKCKKTKSKKRRGN